MYRMRKRNCRAAKLYEETAFSVAPSHFLAFEVNLFHIYCVMDELNFNYILLSGSDAKGDCEEGQLFNQVVPDVTT